MDFVRPDDSPERRAEQDGYFRGQLLDLGELEEAPSLLEAIRRHDEEFEIPRSLLPPVEERLKAEVERLVADLASGRFEAIALDGRIGRLTVGELAGAVSAYGRTLVALPAAAWALADGHPLGSGEPHSLDLPLWTAEEGRSDLTLSLAIVRSGSELRVAIDDLHVL